MIRRRPFLWRWPFVVLGVPLALVGLYTLAVLTLGRLPINGDFANAPDGIPVVVIDNGIHVDFLLPIVSPGHDWRQVFSPAATGMGASAGDVASHVVVGWGHRDFYLETPTWDDLTARTVARALVGIGGTVMHVSFETPWIDVENRVLLILPPENYRRLVDAIVATAVLDGSGSAKPVDAPGYSEADAFYEAEGRYSALYTCNNWAASVLAAAGVRTPVWSPFSSDVMEQLRTTEP